MAIVVSGSIAYDYIMNFDWKFKNYFLPEKLDNISLSFVVSNVKKEAWGTWSNIAYNLQLLAEEPILLWAVWYDFKVPEIWSTTINYNYIVKVEDKLTASAYITSDSTWSQITSFHPWALNDADNFSISKMDEKIDIFMNSPNQLQAMLRFATQCDKLWVKSFFDPWQMLPMFDEEMLKLASELSTYLIVNEYEYELFLKESNMTENEILNEYEKIIITKWKEWVTIIDSDSEINVSAVQTDNLIDSTWAGDAFRWWLLKGLYNWLDWETSAKIGCVCSHYCIQSYGNQNYNFTMDEFKNKYYEAYWEDLNI